MMVVAQRRRDKDIGHLPEKRDKSKLRDDRKKPVGIDSKDPDLNDTMRDPDLKSGSVAAARELVAMARELIAYKYGDVQAVLLKAAGVDASPSGMASIAKSADAETKEKLEKSVAARKALEGAIERHAKFGGSRDSDFVEYAWFLLGLGEPLLVADGKGGGSVDSKSAERLHDAWTLFKSLGNTNEVGKEVAALRKKVKSRSVGFDAFIATIDALKEKYKSMTVNSHLPTDERDAWERLESGRRWKVGAFDVYEVNDYGDMNAVAGDTSSHPTEWCVAHEKKFFDDYKPPYYMFARGHEPETLVHLGSRQARDEADDPEERGANGRAVVDFLCNEFSYNVYGIDELMAVLGADNQRVAREFIQNEYDDDFLQLTGLKTDTVLLSDLEADHATVSHLSQAGLRERYDGVDLRTLGDDEKTCIAGNWRTPSDMLDALAFDPDQSVREIVASHGNLNAETALAMLDDKSEPVLVALAHNPYLPSSIKTRLAQFDSPSVQFALAASEYSTASVLEMLADSKYVRVVAALASNENTPVEVLEKLFRHSPFRDQIAGQIAQNSKFPAELLDEVADSDDNQLRVHIAQLPRLGEEVKRKLARDPWAAVRRAIASRADLPDDLYEFLSHDGNASVRQQVASNYRTPDDVLGRMAWKDEDESVRRVATQSRRERFRRNFPEREAGVEERIARRLAGGME